MGQCSSKLHLLYWFDFSCCLFVVCSFLVRLFISFFVVVVLELPFLHLQSGDNSSPYGAARLQGGGSLSQLNVG